MTRRFLILAMFAAIFAALSSTIADARVAVAPVRTLAALTCDTSWTGGDGDWSQSFHWTGGVPDSTKSACLPAGAYTVSIAGESVQARTLQIGAGPTLSLQITGCSPASAVLTLSGDMTNYGTVDLGNPGDACGGTARIVVPSGSTLTNNGTIQTSGSSRGDRELSGNVTNNGSLNVAQAVCFACIPKTTLNGAGVFDNHGTVRINDDQLLYIPVSAGYEFVNDSGGSIVASGPLTVGGDPASQLLVDGGNTFTQGAGTTSGNAVQIHGDGDTLHFTGSGTSSFLLHGTNTISGTTIAAGQTLDLDCGPRSAVATLAASLTSNGTILLDNSGNACGGGTAQIVVPSGSTLTNNGTIRTSGCCGSERKLSGNITNYGTVEIGHNQFCCDPPTLTLEAGVLDNYGAVHVDPRRLSVVDSTVIAELGGTIDLGGSGIYSQNGGSTLAVTIDAVHTTFSGISGGYTNLDGTLRVTTLGTPAGGSHWPIISGVSRSGTFSAYSFGGINYTVEYPSTGVTLVAPTVVQHPTSTSVSCNPPTVVAGGSTMCAATVSDTASSGQTTPTGTVSFATSGSGSFGSSSCTLAGSGPSASCSVTYTPTSSPSNPVRSDTITASYAGDSTHAGSSGQTTVAVLSISLLSRGSFVIGDATSTAGPITFWSDQWSALNSLSGGAAPMAFKGFASHTPNVLPRCGDRWTTEAGNASSPPDTVPPYILVIVASQITQSDSTISGDTKHVVVVKTDASFAPNVGHPGTGSVVAQIC